MFSCMLSHIPISTRMTIRFCVILIGLCNQVSSLIFWFFDSSLFEVLFVTSGVPPDGVVLVPLGSLSVQVIHLVVYRIFQESFYYDHVTF